MPTTNCTVCQKLYEEQSEEMANHPDRTCLDWGITYMTPSDPT